MTDKLDLTLLTTGVPGLDMILGGGLPELSFNIIGGAPGSGKTTLAQQIMFALATPARKALFFTAMGEPPVKMLRYQQQFTFFDFDKVGNAINFINLAPAVETGNYDAVLAQIREEVRAHSPALVFIDSFRSFVQAARGDQVQVAALQLFVQQLVTHMTGWNATTFLIGEYLANETDQNPIFTVADGIVWLHQEVQSNTLMRKIQVMKMRGRRQHPGLHAFRITTSGIDIFPRVLSGGDAPGKEVIPRARTSRVSLGVPVLDDMMGGGLPAGYSLLVVGPSGSGKSILATEFVAEGVRQNETAVMVLFEKTTSHMLNARLERLLQSGKVALLNIRTLDLSLDEMLRQLDTMIDDIGATRVVLDSLSGFELALAPEFSVDFRESLYRVITLLSEKGVTLLMTSELGDRIDEMRFSPRGSAFLVDAIVMQRYVEAQYELHTVISVIKVRDSGHSRQLRAFRITDDGIEIDAGPARFRSMLRLGDSEH